MLEQLEQLAVPTPSASVTETPRPQVLRRPLANARRKGANVINKQEKNETDATAKDKEHVEAKLKHEKLAADVEKTVRKSDQSDNCQAEKQLAKSHEALHRVLSAAGSNHVPSDMRTSMGNMADRIRAIKIERANHVTGAAGELKVPANLGK